MDKLFNWISVAGGVIGGFLAYRLCNISTQPVKKMKCQ